MAPTRRPFPTARLAPQALLKAVLVLAALVTAGAPGHADPDEGGVRSVPWFGLAAVDPFAPGAKALPARFARLEPLLVRTTPVAWGRLVPVAPVMDGRQLGDYAALDAFVAAWQQAGHVPVLVLDPRADWLDPSGGAGDAGLPPGRWDDWQAFVRNLVERYDADGQDDAPGLARAVRWIQVLERPRAWTGGPKAYARLLHHARLGARQASPGARILHGGVRLAPDAGEPDEAERISLGLSHVYDGVVLEGGGHLGDEADALGVLATWLGTQGRDGLERWLAPTPVAKLDAPSIERAGGPDAKEARVRARWRATARLPGHAEHARALAWYERGAAFDLVRTLARAHAAGASRVLFGGEDPALSEGGGGGSTALFLAAGADEETAPRATLFALAQAARLLGAAEASEAVAAGGGAAAHRFRRGGRTGPPWVVVVTRDADEDWAGDPREDPRRETVVLRVPPGRYRVEAVQVAAEPPPASVLETPDGVLRLAAGPSPLYVVPEGDDE